MRSALALLATILASAAGAANDCDDSYRCEYYYATSGGLTRWNFESLCSTTGYTHQETDAGNTTFSFNICGLSPTVCAPEVHNTTSPSRGVVIQESFGTCYIAGAGFPNFVPLNPDNPASGGINITHDAVPEPIDSPKKCANVPGGPIVSRTTKYMMLCDQNVPTIEVDSAIQETECQYVIVMRSQAACGVANPAGDGGNCLAPPQPPGLTQGCSSAEATLSQNILGFEAEFQAWNKACLAQCDPTLAVACSADCKNHIDEYVQDCYGASGSVYQFAQAVTYASGATVTINSYKCIASACNPDDISGYQAYASSTQCSIVDTSKEMPTDCKVTVTASGIEPTPSAAPIKPTPSPVRTATPTATPPTPSTPSAPSPSPTPAPASGGAVAGAIFATFAGLAVVAFGGYHAATHYGFVTRESVPSGARYCLECGCLESIRRSSLFNRSRAGEATSFTSSGAGGGVAATSSSVASSSFGAGGVGSGPPTSSGGGYQTI